MYHLISHNEVLYDIFDSPNNSRVYFWIFLLSPLVTIVSTSCIFVIFSFNFTMCVVSPESAINIVFSYFLFFIFVSNNVSCYIFLMFLKPPFWTSLNVVIIFFVILLSCSKPWGGLVVSTGIIIPK